MLPSSLRPDQRRTETWPEDPTPDYSRGKPLKLRVGYNPGSRQAALLERQIYSLLGAGLASG